MIYIPRLWLIAEISVSLYDLDSFVDSSYSSEILFDGYLSGVGE